MVYQLVLHGMCCNNVVVWSILQTWCCVWGANMQLPPCLCAAVGVFCVSSHQWSWLYPTTCQGCLPWSSHCCKHGPTKVQGPLQVSSIGWHHPGESQYCVIRCWGTSSSQPTPKKCPTVLCPEFYGRYPAPNHLATIYYGILSWNCQKRVCQSPPVPSNTNLLTKGPVNHPQCAWHDPSGWGPPYYGRMISTHFRTGVRPQEILFQLTNKVVCHLLYESLQQLIW